MTGILLQVEPLGILNEFGTGLGGLEIFGAIILLGLAYHFARRGMTAEVMFPFAIILSQALARTMHGVFDAIALGVLVIVLGAFAYGVIKTASRI